MTSVLLSLQLCLHPPSNPLSLNLSRIPEYWLACPLGDLAGSSHYQQWPEPIAIFSADWRPLARDTTSALLWHRKWPPKAFLST